MALKQAPTTETGACLGPHFDKSKVRRLLPSVAFLPKWSERTRKAPSTPLPRQDRFPDHGTSSLRYHFPGSQGCGGRELEWHVSSKHGNFGGRALCKTGNDGSLAREGMPCRLLGHGPQRPWVSDSHDARVLGLKPNARRPQHQPAMVMRFSLSSF